MNRKTPRFKLTEGALPGIELPGSIKERLQVRPEIPPRKKPAGEEWTKNISVDRMGAAGSNAVETTKDKFVLEVNRYGYDPAYDDTNRQNMDLAQHILKEQGYISDRTAITNKETDDHNEHFYEEVTDKETGKKGLLYRNNIFDRQ